MSSNSVFINYRRSASSYLAQLVWRELTDAGIDAFYDINSLDAGHFDQFIFNQIAARPYFMPILSPGTLERCQDPGDWVLREMQEALRLKRVIVPLVTEEFSFADFDKYLPADLATELQRYNAVPIPPRWFKYAMAEVRERFLRPIDIPTTPAPISDTSFVAEKRALAASQPEVTENQLKAHEYFERAYARPQTDFDGKIADYSEAIRLDPQYLEAYHNRMATYVNKGDWQQAILDSNYLLSLKPDFVSALTHRGLAYLRSGDLESAIVDFTKVIVLSPDDPTGYVHRGISYQKLGETEKVIADYQKALELAPKHRYAIVMGEFLRMHKP